MSSIATAAVFKSTIGSLVEKGRDEFAKKLKDGDVTDGKFYPLIVSEIDDIMKSKLNASSEEDLKTSISFFKEGMAFLLGVTESTSECGAVTGEAACDGRDAEAFSLIKGISRLEVSCLDRSATTKLSAAKEIFENARGLATKAFKNEDLN